LPNIPNWRTIPELLNPYIGMNESQHNLLDKYSQYEFKFYICKSFRIVKSNYPNSSHGSVADYGTFIKQTGYAKCCVIVPNTTKEIIDKISKEMDMLYKNTEIHFKNSSN
jgi:hypothetical protein